MTMQTNQPTGRFLLQVRLNDGTRFTKTFNTEEDMKEYVKLRDFFFVTADYTVYDLAIQLRKGKTA